MNESFDIRTSDGKLFCKCTKNDEEIQLCGKNCSMPLQELLLKIYDPKYHTPSN